MLVQTKEGNKENQVLEFTLITCCSCGLPFMAPELTRQMWRRDKTTFYCPNGHAQSYTKSSLEIESEKLKRQLLEKDEVIEQRNNMLLDEMNKRREAERKIKRAEKGVCTCCNRSFPNLAAHMKTKHPEKVPPAATIIKPKRGPGRPRKN